MASRVACGCRNLVQLRLVLCKDLLGAWITDSGFFRQPGDQVVA